MTNQVLTKSGVVVISRTSGHTVIAKGSPLRRLNYFDGKFLRAADLKLEQLALLNQVRLSNQAGGAGVVSGYNCFLISGDRLRVTGGFAIDPLGRLLHLADEIDIGIAELIEKSRPQAAAFKATQLLAKSAATFDDCEVRAVEPPGDVLEGQSLYLITVGHAEAFCGEEDVYGKLCEEACITSTERPYVLEGVVIRAVPLSLSVFLAASNKIALSNAHLRSRVASAYFEQERQSPASLISRDGLASNIWCLGAQAEGGTEVPIAVMARSGNNTLFLDAWIAKRERMESPPRRYWAGRMAMRPWNVFLAQVLQFQCQLTACFKDGIDKVIVFDPCLAERKLAARASETMKAVINQYQKISKRLAEPEAIAAGPAVFEIADMQALQKDLSDIAEIAVANRYLINCGIVELPSAGYLPIAPGETLTVNEQVRRLMGEGVDLRFCVVRPDYVPHALEEAQHMERISLLKGVDDPSRKPPVDVLVPNGRIEQYRPETSGTGYEMDLLFGESDLIGTDRRLKAAYTKAGVGGAASEMAAGFKGGIRINLAAAAAVRAAEKEQVESRNGVRGAARGERLQTGGYAFYYAGRTHGQFRLTANMLATRQVRNLASLTKLAAAVDASFSSSAAAAKAESGTNSTEAVERLGSGLRINATAEDDGLQYNIWTSMRTEYNLFQLRRHESTNISCEFIVMFSSISNNQPFSAILEMTQHGTLTVNDILAAGAEPRIRCDLNTNGINSATVVVGGQRQTETSHLRIFENVYISRENTGGARPTLRVRVPSPSFFGNLQDSNIDIDIEFRFERAWPAAERAYLKGSVWMNAEIPEQKDPAAGSTFSARETVETEVTLFEAEQRINPDVLLAGHPLHEASLQTLRIIGNTLDVQGFADIRARQLFPPPKPVPQELRIFAKHDWVLFHRRRDIVCHIDKLPEVISVPRRYRLYHINNIASPEHLELVRKALRTNNSAVIKRFNPEAVDIIEFEAGLHAVRNTHDDVRIKWKDTVAEDSEIVLGAIASRGAAFDEGFALAKLRLESLSDVLKPVTAVGDEAAFDTLEKIPDVLTVGENDGVIVMVTMVSAVTVCHEVYRAEMANEADIKIFHANLQQDLRNTLADDRVRRLARDAHFAPASANFAGSSAADLRADWTTVGNRAPTHSILAVNPGAAVPPSVPNDQPYEAQTAAIAQVAGAIEDGFTKMLAFPQTGYEICSAVTVLIVPVIVNITRLSNLYAASTSAAANVVTSVSESISFDENGTVVRDEAFESALARLKEEGTMLKSIELVNVEEPAEGATDPKAEALLAALKDAGVAEENATVNLRKANATEKKTIAKVGAEATGGLVFRK